MNQNARLIGRVLSSHLFVRGEEEVWYDCLSETFHRRSRARPSVKVSREDVELLLAGQDLKQTYVYLDDDRYGRTTGNIFRKSLPPETRGRCGFCGGPSPCFRKD